MEVEKWKGETEPKIELHNEMQCWSDGVFRKWKGEGVKWLN
jgi:hypothetical protein